VRFGALFRSVLLYLSLAATAFGEQPKMIREFKRAALVEVSRDGRWILTSSFREIECLHGQQHCFSDVLTVYDNANRKPTGEILLRKPSQRGIPNRFLSPEFTDAPNVRAIESTWDDQQRGNAYAILRWDPILKSEERRAVTFPKDFWYKCFVDDTSLLGVAGKLFSPPYTYIKRNGQEYVNPNDPVNRLRHREIWPLEVVTPGSPPRTVGALTDPPLASIAYGHPWTAWRLRDSFLLEDTESDDGHFGKSLSWFTPQSGAAPRLCHSFGDERIRGYALSPDRSRIAVITTRKGDPQDRAYLNVLAAASCAQLNRFELEFPEKPQTRSPLLAPSVKYLDNIPFPDQFARSVAISPDNALLAVAYGIKKRSSGLAFFGVYSMLGGRRLATLKGDTFTPNLYDTFMLDMYSAREAPLAGNLQFSADSKSLYTSSWRIREWDVSGLRN
jgi:hypothetical protein